VFLDEGETQQLALGLELHPLLLDELAEDVGAPRQECPHCNEILVSEHLDLADEDIELDVCTVCHGIWIREDELSTMQAMVAAGPPLGEAEIDEIWDEQLPPLRRRERIAELLGTLGRREP
jgi:Zn-finger nucleic acid-binding protein